MATGEMETVDRWLEDVVGEAVEYDEKLINKTCHKIADGIRNRRFDLLNVLEKLEPVITEKCSDKRERGTYILAEVLQNLPKDFLQESELHFLALFFCDRLKDYNIVIPAVLRGILALVQMHYLPRDAPLRIMTAIFEHVQCQTHKQDDRSTIYKILEVLTQKYRKELHAMGPDLVAGIISTIDGERDPRNLLQLFTMLPAFLTAFPLGHLAEEMFDVMACYFPIDLYSTPNDPEAVTRDELAAVLIPCLVAVPEFAEFCVPLLLEKLDSQLRIAKMDSLKLLQASCSTFRVADMEKSFYDLCNALQQEIVTGLDQEMRKEILAAVKALVCLVCSTSLRTDRVRTLLSGFVTRGCQKLQNEERSTFQPSAEFLLAISSASPLSCEVVSNKVVPLLVQQSESGPSEESLGTLTRFLAVCDKLRVAPAGLAQAHALYLDMAQGTLRLEGLRGLVASTGLLDSNMRLQAYRLLLEDDNLTRQEGVACLRRLAELYPDEVMESVVRPRLQYKADALHWNAFCCIAIMEPFTSVIVPRLLNFVIDEKDIDMCCVGIKCLRTLVLLPGADAHVHIYLHSQCDAVSRLVSWWLQSSQDEQLMLDTAEVINTVVRSLDDGSQAEVLAGLVTDDILQAPVLLEALVCGVRQGIEVPALPRLLPQLQTLAIHSVHPLTAEVCARLLACLVNKAPDADDLMALLSGLLSTLEAILENSSAPLMQVANTTTLISWIVKALVLRDHKQAELWTDKLVVLLEHPAAGPIAAQGFQLVMQNDEHLSAANHCTVRILYRQRFFQVVEKLVKHYHKAEDAVRSNFLIALTYLLQEVPKVVRYKGLPEYIPLLKEALNQTEVVLLLSTLRTLSDLLESTEPALQDHVHTFLSRFLQLTKFQDSLKVRVSALRCVTLVCNYPIHLLLPVKYETLQQLTCCLDDRKRLVREQAVATCSRWHLLDAATKS